jgi:hypothetical protein
MNNPAISISRWVHFRQLFAEMLRVMVTYPQWLAAAIVTTIVTASLSPTMALINKKALDEFQKGNFQINLDDLLKYILITGVISAGLTVLKILDKIVDKVYETKLLTTLQRTYLRRRINECETEDIARIVYDCGRAKAGLDIIHKDSWKIVFQIISVLLFQITLAPTWFPALVISVLPPLFTGLFFGPSVRRTSEKILKAQGDLVKYTSATQDSLFASHQERFFRQVIRMDVLKATMDNSMDLIGWLGLIGYLLLATRFKGLLPEKILLGDILLFSTNLGLLSKTFGEIIKVNNKCQEAYPALVRVLLPQSAPIFLPESFSQDLLPEALTETPSEEEDPVDETLNNKVQNNGNSGSIDKQLVSPIDSSKNSEK